MKKIEQIDQKQVSKQYTEWLTGGMCGGTCQRPDILLNDKRCNTCEYVNFCLCKNKILKDVVTSSK